MNKNKNEDFLNISYIVKEMHAANAVKLIRRATKHPAYISLSMLVNQRLTQSQAIRFGIEIENLILNIVKISKNVKWINLKNISTNGKNKQIDCLFEKDGKYYYFEIKSSINLDSEKAPETNRKIKDIAESIETQQKISTKGSLLSVYYSSAFKGKSLVRKGYDSLFFMEDFFKLIGMNISEEEWICIIKDLSRIVK